jgi:hypothetical protein
MTVFSRSTWALGALQVGQGGGQLGAGAKSLLGQLLGRLVLDPPLLQERLGLGEARRAVFRRSQFDDAAVGLGARLHLAQGLRAPAQDNGGLVGLRLLQSHADLGQDVALAQVGRRLVRDVLGLNVAELARGHPPGGQGRQACGDDEGASHSGVPMPLPATGRGGLPVIRTRARANSLKWLIILLIIAHSATKLAGALTSASSASRCSRR